MFQAEAAEAAPARDWQKQADLLFVYGTDAAWAAHLAIATTVGDGDGIGVGPRGIPANSFPATALENFQITFCREVSATPRKDCSTGLGGGFAGLGPLEPPTK